MLRKYSILCLAYFLLGISVTSVAAAELNFNQTSIKGLAQAYGFILGQDFSLERIKQEFPKLAPTVTLVNAQFNSSFPSIKSKLKEQLVIAIGKKLFDKMDQDIKKQLRATLGKQVITNEIAQGFFHQVKERAEGKIDSPFVEYLLAVKYLSHPASEFIDGYRQRFNSDGHRKAQGLKLVLQLPRSWKEEEGERPNIVKKWVSQNGTGMEMIHLDIQDAEGYTPTNNEIEAFVSSGEVKSLVPNGATYIDSGVFSLEMRKGYWMEMSVSHERVGIHVYQHSVMSQLFFRGKVIGLICQTMSPIEDRAKADEAYKTIQPLCQQVLNSLVLLQAY